MKAFVTGGTGFVGSAIIRRLLAAGCGVRALVRPGSDARNIAGLPVEIAAGDLSDEAALAGALRGCGCLFHAAADYRLWVPDPGAMYRSNVEGTRNIMLAALAAGVERVVYTSSVATLSPPPPGGVSNEGDRAGEGSVIGHYKRSKHRAEAVVRRLARERGLPAVIVNPSTPVGPGDIKPTPTGRMIVDALSGRMPAYVDTGLNIVHVDDVAEGHLLALEKGVAGESYILGGENLTLMEILTELAFLSGAQPPLWRLPHGLVLPLAAACEALAYIRGRAPRLTLDGVRMSKKRMFFSCEKAKARLGYRPRPARDALADAASWFRENGYC